ncbi:MAG: hypothetical protein HRT41_06800 [Campylobacteraceae bacterium]|nr:hypothetical protein [Campylobacteraceae bacterium]
MKNLRGYKKSYFKLAVIAMFSTLCKLSKIEINMMYHKRAYEDSIKCLDPPFSIFSHNKTY